MRASDSILRRARRGFVRQHDHSDCGVACLGSLIRFYGGNASLERLRELTGTGRDGTTLLGLYQASPRVGIAAAAFRADLKSLKGLDTPAILHVLAPGGRNHFVICFGYEDGRFVISDPARGVVKISEQELAEAWISRTLLTVRPAEDFHTGRTISRIKLQWILRMTTADSGPLSIALFLGVLVSVLSLVMALFSQVLIDDILPNQDALKLTVALGLATMFMLLQKGLAYARQLILLRQARSFSNRMIRYFLERLMHLPLAFFGTRTSGDLVARLNDTQRLQSFVTYVLGGVMINVLVFATAMAFIVVHSTEIGVWVLIGVAALVCLALRKHHSIVAGQRNVMGAYALNESSYVESIQGIEAIKVANAQSSFIAAMRDTYARLQQAIYELGRVGLSFNLWSEVIGVVIIVGVLAASSELVFRDALQIGSLVALLQMTSILVPAAHGLIMANVDLQEASVAFDRMHEFSSLEPECIMPGEPNPAAPISSRRYPGTVCADSADAGPFPVFSRVDVHSLAFQFPGRPWLLEDASLSLSRGEMIALLGDTGSGKSTFLQVLQRLHRHERGSVLVDGVDWTRFSTASWRNALGVVPQHVQIFSGTLSENICLGRTGDPGAVIEFCRSHGFDSFFSQLPDAYETRLGEGGTRISGGQRQLVALARALYRNPQMLLLDEATAGLDTRAADFVLHLLARCKEDMSILFVTHRRDQAAAADRRYVLAQRRIVRQTA